jgi:putative transposase
MAMKSKCRMKKSTTLYKDHRFPPEIIQYAVWLYHRFNLTQKNIEDLLAEHGITVSYRAIRLWCNKFGLKYVHRLKIVTDIQFGI